MDLITKIKNSLKLKLPGVKSQLKMAPSIRNIEALHRKIKPELRESAVLVLLYFMDKQWYVVLIKRPKYNGPHSNQIAFPGGKKEDQALDLYETALREAHEEIGIEPDKVTIIGELTSLFIPVSNMLVLPVVGMYSEVPKFIPCDDEVDEIIQTPVLRFIEKDVIKLETIMVEDRQIDAPYFDIQGHHVWGATAMMLSEFREILQQSIIQE